MRKLSIGSLVLVATLLALAGRSRAHTAPCTPICDSTLTDKLTILLEPSVTQGLTNTVRFKFPALKPGFLDSLSVITTGGNARLYVRVEHDGVCDQSVLSADYDLRAVIPDSTYSVTVTRFNGQPLLSGETYGYSLGLEIFTCPTGNCPNSTNLKSICLPFTMKSVISTQDDQPPTAEIDSEFTESTCLTDSSFDIPFKAWDEISGGVDSVSLWVRHDSTGNWIADTTIDVDIEADSEPSARIENFPFTRSQDGYHEFLITARDIANHPEWTPDNPRQAGNPQPRPDSSDSAQAGLNIDTIVPRSRAKKIPEVQALLCLDIPYYAYDLPRRGEVYESGLTQVTLYYRHDSMAEFAAWPQTHDFKPPTTARIDSMFEFLAREGDGVYEFYTQAADDCGNVQQFHPDSIVTTEVQATPRIVNISLDTTMFHHAKDVGSIEITFDRIVLFADSSCDSVVQVSNEYNNGTIVPGTCQTDITPDSTTRLIWFPDDTLSTSGLFDVDIDLSTVQTRDPECGLEGQSQSFRFFTFMEIEQGGSIRATSFQIIVPQGAPSDAIVIMEQGVMGGPCGYEGATEIQGSLHEFNAVRALGLSAGIEVPGTLGLGYTGLSVPSDPRTLRIFEQLPEGCLPAGEKETWRVATDISFVFATVENVNSEFFLVSIGATDEAAIANYPNPFGGGSDATKITYTVTDPSASLSLRIYDQFGNLVKAFRPDQLTRHLGANECPWDGKNDLEELVASGGYICVFEHGGKKHIRKIAVLR